MKTFNDWKEVLSVVTEDAIIDIMAENGSPVYGEGETSDGQKYLIFRTICHHGDSHKLYYYVETKTFHCYTNCGTMSVFDLVKKVRGYGDEDFAECVQYVANKAGYSVPNKRKGIQVSDGSVKRVNSFINFMEELVAKKENFKRPEITKIYDKKILSMFDPNTFYQGWLDEGMSFESLHKFGIRYYWGENYIIIPHVNDKNELVGIRRRSLKPEDANNKYMPIFLNGHFYDHPLGLNLYGLYENQKAISAQKTAILFEGEKSVILSDTYFGNNSIAVATCGFNITDWQIHALLKLGVETVYIAFDKDFDIKKELKYKMNSDLWSDYLAYRKRLNNLAMKMINFFSVKIIFDTDNILKDKDSPIDRGKDNFNLLLSKAKVVKQSKRN